MTIIDDDLDGETKDLFVTIDNPEKHTTTMESYITFRITTKVWTLHTREKVYILVGVSFTLEVE